MKEDKYIQGFKVPNDYFESVEDSVFNAIQLDSVSKDAGFKVPETYFDSFDETLFEKLSEEKKETKVLSLVSRKTILLAASIAACMAILIATVNFGDASTTQEIASIASYIDEGNLDMDVYDITNLLDEESLDILEQENTILANTSIEDYLLETIEDNTLLIE